MSRRHRLRLRRILRYESFSVSRDEFAKKAWRYTCSLERCWPYKPEVTTAGGGGPWGEFDVKNIDPHFTDILAMTEDQLRYGIMEEITGAMWYTTVAQPDWSEWQALDAHRMYYLVNHGITRRQPFAEIPRPLEATANADYDLHYRERHEQGLGKDWWINHLITAQWPESGRYIVDHYPIAKKPLDELRAIYLVVCDAFENMC